MEDLHKFLIDRLNSSVEFTVETFLNDKCDNIVETLRKMPLEDIPLHLNDYGEGAGPYKFLKARLAGEEPDSSVLIELLYDEEFDVEDYKNLGYNDGQASLISELLDKLGDKENSERANRYVYSE